MEPQLLNTENRNDRGKGAARQLRMRGLVPGVFYGPGIAPIALATSPKDLTKLLTSDHRRNTLIQITVDGQDHLAMVKDLQVHPVTREILHVDLYKVALDRPVDANVPFRTHGRPKGVIAGGELHVVFRELPVRCAPDKIPASIEIDVSALDVNDHLKVKELQLPEGVSVTLEPERNIVAVVMPRRKAAAEDEAAGAAAAS